MGQGKDLYEENKNLKAEIQRMHDQSRSDRDRREAAADELAELAMTALKSFLKGEAILSINPGNSEGCHMVSFRMPPQK